MTTIRAGGRRKLAADITYFVATTGDDGNDGLTVGTPFLTLQHAWDVISTTLDLAGHTATIQMADGTYTAGINDEGSPVVGGIVLVNGDVAAPDDVVLNVTGSAGTDACFDISRSEVTLSGFRLQTTTLGHCLFAREAGTINVGEAMVFGDAANSHIEADSNGTINILEDYEIDGDVVLAGHVSAVSGGLVDYTDGAKSIGITVTLTDTPDFGDRFAFVNRGGIIRAQGVTWSGSATGRRYWALQNGIIQTNNQSETFFPGDEAGTVEKGARVDSFDGVRTTGAVAPNWVSSNNETALQLWSYNAIGAANSPAFTGRRARGTFASPAAINSGDRLAQFLFGGFFGTGANDFSNQAAAIAYAAENWASGARGTRWGFDTTPTGSATRAERLRIGPSGEIYFNTLGTTGSAANAFLDSGSSPANQLLRSTSSLAFKKDVEPIDDAIADDVLRKLQPIWFRSLAPADKLPDGSEMSFYSFGAEPIAEIDPRFATWGYPDDAWDEIVYKDKLPDGSIDLRMERRLKPGAKKVPVGINDRALIAMLVHQTQKLLARVTALEGRREAGGQV